MKKNVKVIVKHEKQKTLYIYIFMIFRKQMNVITKHLKLSVNLSSKNNVIMMSYS
jgi:hypothetical protein